MDIRSHFWLIINFPAVTVQYIVYIGVPSGM